ncbi:hypothetical protein AOL_s00076g548 [Orbilia oligospora ATCC 24927]|uniref:Plastocyanin-like domain-containing protein n=1 Tax=Arthrobotrys oligospora (strain ATCC 24927 / CBS 115.81 / DSM 1491) TaxID=756982 RepID=G1XA90_ARTOA|nr:hypothetical protein AOL_s00076g548 [Orbilia oligospora ATCC 24927]EGX49907.1 hypothetical protein AOL_s00076g548 [Orbilia oligospora ATCC 24927]
MQGQLLSDMTLDRQRTLRPISNCRNQKLCRDEPKQLIKPILKKSVPPPPLGILDGFFVSWDPFSNELKTPQSGTEWRWNMANSTFFVDWAEPTYSYLGLEGAKMPFPHLYQPIYLNKENKWAYFIISANFTRTGKTPLRLDHPIHLHGHDFFVLAQVINEQVDKNVPVTYDLGNPMRRDTTVLPGGGFLVIAFETRNPGAWLTVIWRFIRAMDSHYSLLNVGVKFLSDLTVERQGSIVDSVRSGGKIGKQTQQGLVLGTLEHKICTPWLQQGFLSIYWAW